MQVKLTKAFVAKAKAEPGAERTVYWDKTLPGFGLMVTVSGHRSFVLQYRANGISRRLTLNGAFLRHEKGRDGKRASASENVNSGPYALADARREAAVAQGALGRGRDPVEELRRARNAERNTLRAVAEEFLAREGKQLRSLKGRQRVFQNHIYPRLGSRPISEIKRSEIVRLLDHVEDNHGPVASQHTLVAIRRLFNWHAARGDDFLSPIVPGMARISISERARDRTLSDDELRAVLSAAEGMGAYGALVRFILLTGTRLAEAARMNRSELKGTEWTIPGARYKTGLDHVVPLSAAAQEVLNPLRVGHKGWVFTTSGDGPISGFTFFKAKLDRMVLQELRRGEPDALPLPRWTTHDLRRTARSLMSRAGVPADHAERCLGHVIGGVRGTYDRHAYFEEKRLAFEALAALVDRIVSPQANVVPMRVR